MGLPHHGRDDRGRGTATAHDPRPATNEDTDPPGPNPTGAHLLHGRIHGAFDRNGAQASLGYPTMDEHWRGEADRPAPRAATSTSGSALILWSPAHDAHVVRGPIHDAFVAAGREAAVGYPTGPARRDGTDGLAQTFEARTIRWNPTDGATVTAS